MTGKRIVNLDVLRGAAVLAIVLYSLDACCACFDKGFKISSLIRYEFPGHLMVLILFALSGYVVGLSTSATGQGSAGGFIRKAVIRVIPIYFIGVFFAWVVGHSHCGITELVSNLFFISVPINNVIPEGRPAWTMHYGLVCYLVFMVLNCFRISLAGVVKFLLITIIANFLFFEDVKASPLAISYIVSLIFWLTGAALAEQSHTHTWSLSASRILSLFLLIFCVQTFNPYDAIINTFHLTLADYSTAPLFQRILHFSDLFYYPPAVLLMLALTHTYSKKCRLLIWFVFIAASSRLIAVYIDHFMNAPAEKLPHIIPSLLLVLSIVLWIVNTGMGDPLKQVLRFPARFSSMAYALYMVHMPLLFLFGMMQVSSLAFFVVKLIVYFAVLFALAWVLEVRLQPLIKSRFISSR